MAVTRLSVPSGSTPAISPAFESGWGFTSQAVRRSLSFIKGTTAITTESTIDGGATNGVMAALQLISPPLKAGSVSSLCTIKAQFLAREFAASDNVDRPQIYAAFVSNDGSTVISTLYSRNIYVAQNELLETGFRNQKWADGDAIGGSGASWPDGARLLIEIGARCFSGTTPQFAVKTGEDASDLPEDNSQTTDGACWVELSETIEPLQPASLHFDGPAIVASGSPVVSGSGSLHFDGPAIAGAGAPTVTGSGGLHFDGPAIAGAGAPTVTGSGEIHFDGPAIAAYGPGSGSLHFDGPAIAGAGAPTVIGSGGLHFDGPKISAAGGGGTTGSGGLRFDGPKFSGSGSSAPQKARPTSLVSNNGWQPFPALAAIETLVDEGTDAPDDDVTYTYLAPDDESATFVVGLAALNDPGTSYALHTLKVRARATSNITLPQTEPAPGLPDVRTTVKLLVGSTEIARRTMDLISSSWSTFAFTLTPVEVKAIRDLSGYGSLRVSVTAGSKPHDTAQPDYEPRVSAIQLEIAPSPSEASPAGLLVTAFRGEAWVRRSTVTVEPLPLPDTLLALIRANWQNGVELDSDYMTDVERSAATCAEERRALRPRPIRSLGVDLAGFRRPDELRTLIAALRLAQQRCPVPLFCDFSDVTAASSGTDVWCDTRWRRFFVGARVLVHGWVRGPTGAAIPGVPEVGTIAGIEDDHLVLAAPLARAYGPGGDDDGPHARVYPLIDAEITLTSQVDLASDDVARMRLEAAEVTGPSALPPTASEGAIVEAGYDSGFPIFDVRPDWSRGVSIDVERAGDSAGLGRGLAVSADGARAQVTHELDVTTPTREATWRVVRFFDSRRGRKGAFWLAQPDSPFALSALPSDPTERWIDVDAAGEIDDVREFVERLAVVRRDGSVLVREIESIDDNGGTWRLNLDRDLPPTITADDVDRLTVARLVRFDSDSLGERWETDELCRFRLRFLELLDERAVEIDHVEDIPEFGDGATTDPTLYLWCLSEHGTWRGDHPGASTERVERCYQKLTPEVDFWDDVRINGDALIAQGLPFPKPHLARRLDSADVGPFFVLFKSWKKSRGRPCIEHSGVNGARFWLENNGAPFWSNSDGLTFFYCARLKKTEAHHFVRRDVSGTNVIDWRHDRVDLGASYSLSTTDVRGSARHIFVLRWRPGAELRVWRDGVQMGIGTVLVPATLDVTATDTEVGFFQSEVDGPQGQAGIKQQAYSMGLRIYRRALDDGDIDDVAQEFKKLFGARWRALT